MDCDNLLQRRVKLGYVADCAHCVQLVDSIGNQVFDMLPVIQGGETETSFELLTSSPARLRYYPETYSRTEGREGCVYDVCISDIAALINLNDLGDVDADEPLDGETIVYNSETQNYELFNLEAALTTINTRIDNLEEVVEGIAGQITAINTTLNEHTNQINSLTQQITTINETLASLAARLQAIENAIYNWSTDKATKIPRGNINITSGGYNGDNGIFTRTKNQENDLDFQ